MKEMKNVVMTEFQGGGSLKASLAKVFSLVKSDQGHSDRVVKECSHPECSFCHAELGSASHVVVCHVKRKVGKIPNQVWNDNSSIGEGNGINSITNLSPYRPNALTPLAKAAFTMAEILLSLTIIGVVAAITLPSLTGNINERTWNTQRKALHARMSQAIALMPNLNGYGSSDDWEGTAAEAFVSGGLSKVLKINNVCDSEHLADCGLPAQITTLSGSIMEFPTSFSTLSSSLEFYMSVVNAGVDTFKNIKVAGMETQNGESIAVYYNPFCRYEKEWDYGVEWLETTCANFVYDLNGAKGPNSLGKDIGFITAFKPTDPLIVAPVLSGQLSSSELNFPQGVAYCKNMEDSRLPNINEVDSMVINGDLIGMRENRISLLSGTTEIATSGHFIGQKAALFTMWGDCVNFRIYGIDEEGIASVQCVKR